MLNCAHRLNKGLRSTCSFNVTPAVHLSMTYLVRGSCYFELPPDLSVNAHSPMYEVSGGVRVNVPDRPMLLKKSPHGVAALASSMLDAKPPPVQPPR
jgi:hypothetical protein